jgi:hypothetical protein
MRGLLLALALMLALTAVPKGTAVAQFNPQPDPPGKMTVNAKFYRAIDNPDIREVRLTGTVRCDARSAKTSYLTVKIGRAALFVGQFVRNVTCKYLKPTASRMGGSWGGEVVGTCGRKPAVVQLFVSDDTRGGGAVRLSVKGLGANCTLAVTSKNVVGSLTAFMGRA